MKNVLLDECVNKRPSRVIKEFLSLHKPPIRGEFLLDLFGGKQGLKDEDWSTIFNEDKNWIVITADSSIRSPRVRIKGTPLHLVLPTQGITSFFLSGKKTTQANGMEKARIVIATMPEILEKANTAEPGTRFRVRFQGQGIHVAEWPLSIKT